MNMLNTYVRKSEFNTKKRFDCVQHRFQTFKTQQAVKRTSRKQPPTCPDVFALLLPGCSGPRSPSSVLLRWWS